jgi:hypothetical protein
MRSIEQRHCKRSGSQAISKNPNRKLISSETKQGSERRNKPRRANEIQWVPYSDQAAQIVGRKATDLNTAPEYDRTR